MQIDLFPTEELIEQQPIENIQLLSDIITPVSAAPSQQVAPTLHLTHSPISKAAIQTLQQANITDNQVKLNAQLGKDLYDEVNEVLRRLGGQWKSGRTKAHVFSYDPAEALQFVLEAGYLPDDNPLDFYASTPEVVEAVRIFMEPYVTIGASC